jgi:hypothetical protein
MSMSPALILTLLLQVAAAKPTPTPTPVTTPTSAARVPAHPRTLQDVARERRLKTTPDAKGTGTTITLGSTPGATPASTPSASSAASGEKPAGDAPSAADMRVLTVSNDGVVDSVGVVRVSGTIRNAGDQMACGVVILVRILDNKGNYLASAQTPADVNILPVGETASFHTNVQAPPGVRGARTNPDRRDVTDGSTTMGGDWKVLGGAEAKVVDASACPK